MNVLSPSQRQMAAYWLPALTSGAIAWITFVALGQTPFIRASGLALVVVGVALTLRRLGAGFTVGGSLALAYSPAFWSQTGGGESLGLATIVLALIAAMLTTMMLAWLGKRPYFGLGLGLIIFAIIFWSQIGTPRSLRLTSLLTAWLLYWLIDALWMTNPRPEEPPPAPLARRHTLGIVLLLSVGVLNDPLFVLLTPAVVLGLLLSHTRLPLWFWGVVAAVVVIGVRGIIIQYIDPFWWSFPSTQAENIRVPYILADGWRDAARWIGLFEFIITQFTVLGVLLGLMGLARLARWYPPLGVVTMVAYAAYVLFALVYFGRDRPTLLLPLLIVQVIWMTYAVYAFGQWLQKSTLLHKSLVSWFAPTTFILVPVFMLLRILSSA